MLDPCASLFIRNRGFRQITQGQDIGSFQHHLFRRDKRELCRQMDCSRNSLAAKLQAKQCRLPPKKRLKSKTFYCKDISTTSSTSCAATRSGPTAALLSLSYDYDSSKNVVTGSPSVSSSASTCSSLTTADDFSASTVTARSPSPDDSMVQSSFSGGSPVNSIFQASVVASNKTTSQQAQLLQAAQAMLFDAYQSALRDHQ